MIATSILAGLLVVAFGALGSAKLAAVRRHVFGFIANPLLGQFTANPAAAC